MCMFGMNFWTQTRCGTLCGQGKPAPQTSHRDPSHACPSSSFPPTVTNTSGGVAHQPCTPPRTTDTVNRGAFGTESSSSGESCQTRGPNLSASRASLQNNSNSAPRPRPRPRLCLRLRSTTCISAQKAADRRPEGQKRVRPIRQKKRRF